ncbi:hypothetical protein CCACVL1_29441 [Corchorus capsularis]|uniref:Uncharacterized protein n=1 Tax=Corchorus capsularis TaxID=210143 RepID=A0A1R3G1Q5_COCAP|nr:hypothetical protein CCACVL1_29441 [Corchorus capsularis]
MANGLPKKRFGCQGVLRLHFTTRLVRLLNSTFSDCSKKDPYVKELRKSAVALLIEEIALQRIVSNDTLDRTRAATKSIKKASSKYRKKAEMCIAAVETCEEARERAEAELREELKLTALWKKRARQLGWKGDSKRAHNS